MTWAATQELSESTRARRSESSGGESQTALSATDKAPGELTPRSYGTHRITPEKPADFELVPRPMRKRWVMLFYLSALALLSDWICFSAAPIAGFRRPVTTDASTTDAWRRRFSSSGIWV